MEASLPERPKVVMTWSLGLAAESTATTKPERSLMAGSRPQAVTVTLQGGRDVGGPAGRQLGGFGVTLASLWVPLASLWVKA